MSERSNDETPRPVVWIDPPFEIILERLRAQPGGRPLLATMGDPFDEEKLRAHYELNENRVCQLRRTHHGRNG